MANPEKLSIHIQSIFWNSLRPYCIFYFLEWSIHKIQYKRYSAEHSCKLKLSSHLTAQCGFVSDNFGYEPAMLNRYFAWFLHILRLLVNLNLNKVFDVR